MAGKLVSQTKIKKSSGDLFHELFRHKPHELSKISPQNIQNCDLHDGDEFVVVGSIVIWNYVHEGKAKVAKDIIEVIDDENKLITLKTIEGDPLEVYNSISCTAQVDTQGEDDVVTWTVEYEKPHEDVEDPHSVMDFLISITKDIESHHLQN